MFDFEDEVKDEFLKALMSNMSKGMVDDVKKGRGALSPEALEHAGGKEMPNPDLEDLKKSPGVHDDDGGGIDEVEAALSEDDEESDLSKKMRRFRPNSY